ncbi:MAG: IS4 family transposase [Bacteroidales bacterium]|nr:IS4 family transposase [Bacteroidales bacterium]
MFKRVRVKDSTTFEIHESLANVFEGFGKGGGPNSKAGVSIQFEYDVKTNKVLDIDLKSAIQNDSNDAISKKDDIQKGDLILRDLGYYSDGIIAHYIEREAFFISKLYHNVSVRMNKSDEKKIDFQKIYTQMINLGRTHSDLPVFIGKKRRPVRLISVLVSDEVYQKRMRERAKANKSLGYEISEEYKIRARFNFYICNIPENECTWETICKLYRIRWQIELVFKVWKSILHIDQTHKMKGDRFITMLYVKLLWILINWQIICDCRNLFYKNGDGLLSISKSFQTLKESSKTIIKSMMSQTENIQKIIEELAHSLSQNHWTEKRKSRCHLEEIFDIIFCESVNYSYI